MTAPMTAARLRIGGRDRRALFFGSVVAISALAWSFAIKPYVQSVRAAEAELSVQEGLLRRELDAVAGAPRAPLELARMRAALAGHDERLFSGDAIAATSGLSGVVRDAADESGLALQQLDTKEESLRPSAVRQLTVELRAEGDFQGILVFLNELEKGHKLVHVARLAVERTTSAPPAPNGAEALSLSASIEGFAALASANVAKPAAGGGR
jgi:type II secretory pathway component PulM